MDTIFSKGTIIIVMFLLVSCAIAPVREDAVPEKPRLSAKEQEEKSLEAFKDILESTANVRKQSILPQLKENYLALIDNYPDSYFAEESFFRLMMICLEDYETPRVEEAEYYYKEYFKRYPEPKLDYLMSYTLANFYYRFGQWEKLKIFLEPHIAKYARTGEKPNLFFFFVYCEALFQLNDFVEAEKGYLTIISLFPDSHEAKISQGRLEMMREHESQ